MKLNKSIKTLLPFAAFAGLALSANAAVTSIDFNVGATPTPTESGEPSNAAGLQLPGATTWNALTVDGSADNSVTTVEGPTFTIDPGGSGYTAFIADQNSGTFVGDDLRRDILALNVTGSYVPVAWELTNLTTNGVYSLIFFNRGYSGGAKTKINGVLGATEASEGDYDFTGIVAVGGKISGTFEGDANWSAVSGLQFEQTGVVPEPSTTALLGLGGLALILRRRK